jgi:hypothetical protein
MGFEIRTELDLAAPPEVVWRALTEVERWAEWCTWLRWEGGEFREGTKIKLRLSPPDGKGYAFRPTVLKVEPCQRLVWVGRTGIPGIFDGEHSYLLQPNDKGGTHLINREYFSGIFAPIVRRLSVLQSAKPGFESFNQELQQRVSRRQE